MATFSWLKHCFFEMGGEYTRFLSRTSKALKLKNNRRTGVTVGILSAALATTLGTACSGNKSTLSGAGDVQPSAESEAIFVTYGSLVADSQFKEAYAAELGSELKAVSGTVSVKHQGRVIDDLDGMYKHQIEGMKNASKTKSKKQIADVSRKNVIQFVDSKPLTASDFEIYRQLTNANLLAGKDVSSYVNAMGKFSLQDQARALRVGSVLGAMHRLVLKEQKQGLNLEAMDPVTAGLEAGKSGVDLIKTALETFSPAKLAEANLNNAKADTERARIQGIINQNNLTGLLAKAANACWNAKQNAGSQKWANCRGDGNLSQEAIWPKETCDNDLSRNRKPFPDARPFHTGRNGEDPDVADMLAKEGITGLMSSSGQFGIYRDGNATQGCQEHKWECKCTNGWDWKYIGGGPALKTYWWKHYNSDATGCNWHYSDEKSPPQPFDKAVAKDINCDTGILDYLATAIPLGTKSGE